MCGMRYHLLLALLGLLLSGCAHRDARDSSLREQITGTWTQGDSAEVTFLSDGKFSSRVQRAESVAQYDGKWDVRDGFLVISTTRESERYAPSATKVYSVSGRPNPTHERILHVDGAHLAILCDDLETAQSGPKTNLWERK